MSITTKIQPELIVPAYNEIISVFDSTNRAKPNFQFVIDTEIYGTAQSRVKMSSNPDGYGVFDAHKHIEQFVSYNIDYDNKKTFHQTQSAFTEYDLTVTEQYVLEMSFTTASNDGGYARLNMGQIAYLEIGDEVMITNSTESSYNGIQTVLNIYSPGQNVIFDMPYVATATGDAVKADGSVSLITATTISLSGTNYAFNGVEKWVDVPDWKASGYTTTYTDCEMLTTAHDNYEVKGNDRIWYNFYNVATPAETVVDSLQVLTYDEGGVLNGSFLVDNETSFLTGATNTFLQVGVGPWNLNKTTSNVSITSGSEPMISQDVASYTVSLYNTLSGQTSKTYSFQTNFDCTGFENYRMLYLDRKGSWMNINFNLAHQKKTKIKRTTYQKNYGGYDPVTNTWGYNTYDRGTTQLDGMITETFDIQTDYVKENMGDMVADMMVSPEVYHLSEIEETRNLGSINTYGSDFDGATFWSKYTMASAHGLQVGQKVCVTAGVWPDCEQTVRSVISSTVFTTYTPWNVSASVIQITTQEMSGGVLRAVNINTNSLKLKQRKTDKMINYRMSFEYSNKNTVQR